MRRIMERAALIIWIPIVILLISSILSAFYGGYLFIRLVYNSISGSVYMNAKILTAELLSIMDVYLLVIIQFIFSLGLYELFIGELETPEWLKITTIDHLKAALASFITLFLTIVFVQFVVKAENPLDILYSGVGIASVIGVLVFYYKAKSSDS